MNIDLNLFSPHYNKHPPPSAMSVYNASQSSYNPTPKHQSHVSNKLSEGHGPSTGIVVGDISSWKAQQQQEHEQKYDNQYNGQYQNQNQNQYPDLGNGRYGRYGNGDGTSQTGGGGGAGGFFCVYIYIFLYYIYINPFCIFYGISIFSHIDTKHKKENIGEARHYISQKHLKQDN